MSHPEISVIIGSYNQKEALEKVVQGFLEQSVDKVRYEVIIVDSSSTDGTQEMMLNYNDPIRFVCQENQGKTGARNTGVRLSKAPLILITDADMIPHPDLIKTHLRAHRESKEVTCFEGVTLNLKTLEWPTEDENLYPYIREKIQSGKKLGWWYFLTGNISMPKSLYKQEGGFSTAFQGYGWEDLELGYRLFKKKIPLRYLKEAINYHYHVVTQEEEIARNVKKGESAKIMLSLHPELKWFLGLNPLSLWLFPKIKESGWIYKNLGLKAFHSQHKRCQQFGFWFLKEYHYLKGILNE